MRKQVVFVCGEICSGKSTISKQMAHDQNMSYIEVSDIVRSLLKTSDREQLQKSGYLESQIVLEILIQLENVKEWGCVISGVRQRSIINCIESFSDKYTFKYHWIDLAENIRFERYMQRGDLAKDKLSREGFEEAQQRDNDLGIQDVKKYIQIYQYE